MIRHATRFGLTALVTLTATLVPAALAQARPGVKCEPRHSTTLTSDRYARVYGKRGNAYVCIRSTGRTTLLQNASPTGDQFALGGTYVGWSSSNPADATIPAHSIVTVMHIPDHSINDQWYPGQLNQKIDKIVVLSDGAAAWGLEADPSDNTTNAIIQGTDRYGHPADQFSDDHTTVDPRSLHLVHGKTVGWTYSDGTTGTQALY